MTSLTRPPRSGDLPTALASRRDASAARVVYRATTMKRWREQWLVGAPLLFLAAGCPTTPDFIECVDATSCDRFSGGQCVVNEDTGHRFCAYPDEDCPSGMQWSDRDVETPISGTCVALVDGEAPDASTPVDAMVDAPRPDAAPGEEAFDVGYISEWRLGSDAVSVSQYEWVRIVNMGDQPLDLATATITNVTDNHPQIVVSMTWAPTTTVVEPGNAAGALNPASSAKIVASGLVTEPAQDTASGLVHLSVTNLPPSGTWLGVDGEATLQVGHARATIAVRVVQAGTGAAQTPYTAMRAVSSPVP
jgi:hypothetical protein